MTEKDDLDEHELAELTKEVAKRLERRGVLQAGAGLAAGGAAGYLASGRASAGSQQTGTIGSGGSPVDVVAEDIYGPGGQGSRDSVAFEAVQPRVVSNYHHFAGSYDGSSPDARLSNALNAVEDGDVLVLEASTYSNNISFNNTLRVVGAAHDAQGTRIEGDITLGANDSTLANAQVANITITVDGFNCRLENLFGVGTSVTVNDNALIVTGCRNLDVTFTSGAGSGVVDSCSGTTVTDNDGGNVTGDIA